MNLIDFAFWKSLDISREVKVHCPRIKQARTANKSLLNITGFVVVPLYIQGYKFDVPMNIAENLNQNVILGKKFLKQHQAKIDYETHKLRLYRRSHLRAIDRQEIPPHSQSVVRARVSNKLPNNTLGVCQASRTVNSIGIVMANTVSPIESVTNKTAL